MKRYIQSATTVSNNGVTTTHFDIVYEIEYFELDPVAASTYRGFQIPDGPVISGIPEAILDSQAIADFDAFLESVEDSMRDYYGFDIYYKNKSGFHSCYFGMLAKSADGSLIFDFDFTLRISNHDAHRTDMSEKHKKEKKQALEKVLDGRKKPQPIVKPIIVNGETFGTYMEAFVHICDVVDKVVDIMTRREKYRNKSEI